MPYCVESHPPADSDRLAAASSDGASASAAVVEFDPSRSLNIIAVAPVHRSVLTEANLDAFFKESYAASSCDVQNLFLLAYVSCALTYMKQNGVLAKDLTQQKPITLKFYFENFLPATAALVMATLLTETPGRKKKRPTPPPAPQAEQAPSEAQNEASRKRKGGGGRPVGALCFDKHVVPHYNHYVNQELNQRGYTRRLLPADREICMGWYEKAVDEMNKWIKRNRIVKEPAAAAAVVPVGGVNSGDDRKQNWGGLDDDCMQMLFQGAVTGV